MYDGNGNILKVSNVLTGKDKIVYTYSTGDRIREKKEYNDSTGALLRTTTYTFTDWGAVKQALTVEGANKKTVDYSYSSDEQLIGVKETLNGQIVKDLIYEYDESGNRLAKQVGHTHYHYHRGTDGEIFTITKETPEEGEAPISFYKDANGNLLSLRYNDALYYYQFNARGDVIAITDAAANVAVTYDYDEWGNITSITGDQALAQANPYRYVGKYGVFYDKDTNLYFMGWRDYDPTTGRYLVPDQYEGEEDEPTTLNRYLYAEGDPVNNIDPDGNKAKWLQSGWKSTKKFAKLAYNEYIGNDIKTLRNPKSKWYQKVGAGALIASNFVPGVGQAKWAAKAGIASIKAAKSAKKLKFVAKSLKNTRTFKVKKATVLNAKKKVIQKQSASNGKFLLKLDLQLFAKGVSKSKNKPKQSGIPNSTEFVRGSDGKVSKYTTFGDKGQLVKEVRVTGKDHGNIPRPNVKEPKFNVNPKTGQQFQNGYKVRPAKPNEIPKR